MNTRITSPFGAFSTAREVAAGHALRGTRAIVIACPLQRTADGLEMQIGTNHFGHFLLGVLLAPALALGARERGRPSRLVSLSSIGHRRSGIRWDDPNYLARPHDK